MMTEPYTADGRYAWLVEEYVGTEEITLHLVVIATSPQNAFNLADRTYSKYSGAEFIYGPEKLNELIVGYLWQAGSIIETHYEVRKLYKVPNWIAAGPVTDRMPPFVTEESLPDE
jgi:hypothetical protein